MTRYVVACAESCLTACDFATREEAERALESMLEVKGFLLRRDQLFVRPSSRRDRRLFKNPPASWCCRKDTNEEGGRGLSLVGSLAFEWTTPASTLAR
jgi:hypothetical protein